MKKLVLLVLLLNFPCFLLANETGNVQKVKADVTKSESSSSRTSIQNREGKKGLLAYGLGYTYALGSQQVEALFYHSKDFLYGLEGSLREDTGGREGAKSIAAKLRYFTGNSFNYSFAAFYREYTHKNAYADYDEEELSFFGKSESKGFKDIGASLSIGNLWQWDYFTFGVDWIGAWSAITKLDGRYPEGVFSNKRRRFGVNLLKVSLGLSF